MNYCIITAGGTGTRMNSDIPKQFIVIQGKPILMYTISQFYDYDKNLKIILSLPDTHFDYWKKLCIDYKFKIPHKLVEGGNTRFQSVKNALKFVEGEGYTAIHDGVRPLVTIRSIAACFKSAEKYGTGIASQDIFFSIRQLQKNGGTKAVNRDEYKEIQTPQVFKNDLIKKSYEQNYRPEFTDDASVAEAAGYRIVLARGSRENIKITTPEDLYAAKALLKARWT